MIKDFFKKLFCAHKYEQVAIWEFNDRIDVKFVCSKCGKEHWDIIRY